MVGAVRKLKLTVLAAAVVAALCICPTAQTAPKYKVLHKFAGSDGAGPYGGVIADESGNLYGTAAGGGTYGYGTVFELRPGPKGQWTETALYSFHDPYRTSDGGIPYGGVIFDRVGDLYGTTITGGVYHSGTVFKLARGSEGWTETILYSFCPHSGCKDGGSPEAGLTWDGMGNLYGTGGVVFELSRASGVWKEKVLHRFCSWPSCRDGGGASSGLIFDASGNLYGTTEAGGAYKAGTVYEVRHTPSGWKEQVLHNFPAFSQDGQVPGAGALVFDTSGNLYGTTSQGGTNICSDIGCGTIFRLRRGSDGRWKETILYDFNPGASGSFPGAGVVMDKAGNLYGTAAYGGSSQCGCGVVYKLAPGSKGKWTYTVLHRFSGGDGAIPAGNLILDDQAGLYGGTVLGGPVNDGVVFELTP